MAKKKDDRPNLRLGWHWLPEDKRLQYEDGRLARVGGTLSVKVNACRTILCCAYGLHASEKITDALKHAPGPILCRVECWGQTHVYEDNSKFAAKYRKVLWMVDGRPALKKFAVWATEKAYKYAALQDPRKAGLPDDRSAVSLNTFLDMRPRVMAILKGDGQREHEVEQTLYTAWDRAGIANVYIPIRVARRALMVCCETDGGFYNDFKQSTEMIIDGLSQIGIPPSEALAKLERLVVASRKPTKKRRKAAKPKA